MNRHSLFSDRTDFAETSSRSSAEPVPLREVAQYLGVSISKLKRMIKAGELPEAAKTRTPEGRIWALPAGAMTELATRLGVAGGEEDSADGYELLSVDASGHVTISPESSAPADPIYDQEPEPVLDLSESSLGDSEIEPAPALDEVGAPSFAEALDLALLDRLLGVQEQAVLAVADAERAEVEAERFSDQHRRAEADLAAERQQRAEVEERFHSEQLARVTAESRAAELEMRVRREEALAREERAAASYANMRSLRREREAALATANLNWRGRRRYRRQLLLETPS